MQISRKEISMGKDRFDPAGSGAAGRAGGRAIPAPIPALLALGVTALAIQLVHGAGSQGNQGSTERKAGREPALASARPAAAPAASGRPAAAPQPAHRAHPALAR